jgi:hypothetical protein
MMGRLLVDMTSISLVGDFVRGVVVLDLLVEGVF